MELFDVLLPFLLLLIYFLAQSRKRSPSSMPDVAGENGEQPTERLSAFEQILQQIQQAAEEAQRGPVEQVETRERPMAPREMGPSKPIPKARIEQQTHFRGAEGGFDHEEHGFGFENPFSEEALEQLPRNPPPPPHRPGHLDYDPHARTEPRKQRMPGTKSVNPLARRLKQPGGLREAILLKEILDRPKGMRRS